MTARFVYAVVHHEAAPEPNACRWCGVGRRAHMQRWVPSHGWHPWTEPTNAQRLARMQARRASAVVPKGARPGQAWDEIVRTTR